VAASVPDDRGDWPAMSVVTVPASRADAELTRFQQRADVLYAQMDHELEAQVLPNDPSFPSQGYMTTIGAPQAWDVTRGSPNVLVAVLDTAVATDATTHPDLVGKVLPSVDLIDYTCDPGTSTIDHGTAVTGLIAAATNNGFGIAGLGWNTTVLPIRVLCDNGRGRSSVIANGIRTAADQGAGIINISIAPTILPGECASASAENQVLAEAITYAQTRGVIVVAAAGNSACDQPVPPASLPGVIAVGSAEADDSVSSFSNRGTWVDLIAPGRNVLSIVKSGAPRTFTGTSFASPLVAATAALIVADHPNISADGVVRRLREGSDQVAGTGSLMAWGRLDAGASLAAPTAGYWMTTDRGRVVPFADAGVHGSIGTTPAAPIAAMAPSATGRGYWTAGADGTVTGFGDAAVAGGLNGIPLNRPIVGMAATATGRGYWLVASDGGIFAFGDAVFHGSTGDLTLNSPIVGMAATPTGLGYWLVAADGGVFAFGDARFQGSMGGISLFRPVVGMAPTATGQGYWMVASDGGVFAFGDAFFHGSTGGTVLNQPVVGMTPSAGGGGYWFVARDGGVFAFGEAPFLGSGVGIVTTAVVAFAAQPVS
jgi:Subtilase family